VRGWLLVALLACGGRSHSRTTTAPLVATAESADAAYDAKNWAECATQWISISERMAGEQRTGALYDAACCYALDGRGDAALSTLEAALDAGYWDAEHLDADPDLASVRGHAKWPEISARAKASFAAFEKSLGEPALRRELLALAEQDQKARELDKDIEAVDRENAIRMREIVVKHGWPSKSLVGADGSSAAWLIVQHADHDVAFQRSCLEKMEQLVKSGEAIGKDFAFLWDRVAVNEGRPQRYGTQLDGEDVLPLEDPSNVDARRKALGLSTLAEYKELVRKSEKLQK